jgi:hypothetical protein
MTTKKARSRRLVLAIEHYIKAEPGAFLCAVSEDGTRRTAVRIISRRCGFYLGKVCPGIIVRFETVAAPLNIGTPLLLFRARLAAHDAILRAGWPSPWREL